MNANSGPLHLASGSWELEVQPGRGGAVTALRHRQRPVLVSPDPATADAMGAASFALVPYANRIAWGRFNHLDRSLRLPPNFGAHPHPLHGVGWKRPWSVAALHADGVELQLRHEADPHWPWAFSAVQRISLQSDAVQFELVATSEADMPAPMGVGFHPAFAACATTTLHTRLEGVWLTDHDSVPQASAPAGRVLPELPGPIAMLRPSLVDHCFTGWSRRLRIANAGADGEIALVELDASPELRFLQLYMPPGKPWFCAEPMSQMPDAIHHPGLADHGGLRLLQPGESLRVTLQIAVR